MGSAQRRVRAPEGGALRSVRLPLLALPLLALLLTGGCLPDSAHPHLRDRARALYHHYKNARAQQALAASQPMPERADAPLVVYGDSLGDGWQDWSWAAHDLHASSPTHTGTASVTMAPRDNQGRVLPP